jgi:hypothetical protein
MAYAFAFILVFVGYRIITSDLFLSPVASGSDRLKNRS